MVLVRMMAMVVAAATTIYLFARLRSNHRFVWISPGQVYAHAYPGETPLRPTRIPLLSRIFPCSHLSRCAKQSAACRNVTSASSSSASLKMFLSSMLDGNGQDTVVGLMERNEMGVEMERKRAAEVSSRVLLTVKLVLRRKCKKTSDKAHGLWVFIGLVSRKGDSI